MKDLNDLKGLKDLTERSAGAIRIAPRAGA